MGIIINYNRKINHSESEVFNALSDYKNYTKWWPKNFNISHSKFAEKELLHFAPFVGMGITWEIKPNGNSFETIYKKGPVTGNGIWIIETTSENEIKLHYNIDVTPKNWFFKLLLIKPVFKKMHLKHMKSIFIKLENYLN